MSYSVERYHDISCGHRVFGHESKCAHLHGHNYRIFFKCEKTEDPTRKVARSFIGMQRDKIEPTLDKIGRVIDFSVVKEKLCMWLEDNWDHKFLLWAMDPLSDPLQNFDPMGVVVVPFNPTAENMAEHLVNVIGPMQLLGTGVQLVSCRIEETRKCSATYELS